MTTKVLMTDDYGRNSLKKLLIHDSETYNMEARFACALIERWGLVVGTADGEDSAGRTRFRESSPEEVVTKACAIAEFALQSFRDRGWMVPMPDESEMRRKT
jgi:hypothetical protein